MLLHEPGDVFTGRYRFYILRQGTAFKQLEIRHHRFSARLEQDGTVRLDFRHDVGGGGGVARKGNAGAGEPFAVLVRKAGTEERAARFLGGFKIAHEILHKPYGVGKLLFGGMGFPLGNEVPGVGLVVEVKAADFLERPHFFDADEKAHVFPHFPGIIHKALAARPLAAEASGPGVFSQLQQLGAFFFRDAVGVVSVGNRVPDGKNNHFSAVGLFLEADVAVVKVHGAEIGAGNGGAGLHLVVQGGRLGRMAVLPDMHGAALPLRQDFRGLGVDERYCGKQGGADDGCCGKKTHGNDWC